MEIYTPKPKIKLSPVVRNGREFVEVTFGNDNDIRLSLSKAELELFAEMLRREQNKLAGSKTYSASEMQAETEDLLSES